MKKNILLILLSLSILHISVPAMEYAGDQNTKGAIIPDTLKNAAASPRDTSVVKIKREVLRPLKSAGLVEARLFNLSIDAEKLKAADYRSTSDFFLTAPFGFINDFGSVGYPNELILFGSGNGELSLLSDGISINNRLSNSLDLNLFQSESLGSAEIIPAVRGFLYSNRNNPVSVNLVSRDPDPLKPYSRLRYYQTSNSEGLLDGIFSFNPFSRLNAYVEISNHSTNPGYKNSDYSNWSGTARIRYLLSKDVNITASYRYSKSVIQLNGGVDADSIRREFDASQFNEILYDRLRAPVIFSNRYQKSSVNDLRFRILSRLLENAPGELTFYYQSNLTEFRQNEYSSLSETNTKKIIDDNANKTWGINLRQNFKFGFAEINSSTNIEGSKFNSPLLAEETLKSSFSESVSASLDLFGESFKPAVFGKYLRYSDENYYGIGADALLISFEPVRLYAGFSSFEKPRGIWEERYIMPGLPSGREKISSLELSLLYRNQSINASAGYFSRSSANNLLSTTYSDYDRSVITRFFAASDLTLSGLNFKIDFKFWKFLLSSNTSFYFPSGNRKNYKLPDYTSNGGIYYIDTLFSGNLHLKTGVNYYSIGERDFINYDFEKNISSGYYFNPLTLSPNILFPALSSTFQVDFFLAGKIQTNAIIYFVLENLLDAQYYIIPYYPKQSRGIRFGVSWEFLD